MSKLKDWPVLKLIVTLCCATGLEGLLVVTCIYVSVWELLAIVKLVGSIVTREEPVPLLLTVTFTPLAFVYLR